MMDGILEIGHRYPYLAVTSLGFAVVLIAFATAKRHRFAMFVSGLTYLAALPLYIPFDPVYWRPERLGGWILGIEDVLCLFSLGSLVWLAAVLPLDWRMPLKPSVGTYFSRILPIGAAGVALFTVLWAADCDPLWASVFAQSLIAGTMMWVRRDLRLLGLCGGIIYPLYYCSILAVASRLWPEHETMWTSVVMPGSTALGFPVTEIIWVTTFAAGWPLLIGHALDMRIYTLKGKAWRAHEGHRV